MSSTLDQVNSGKIAGPQEKATSLHNLNNQNHNPNSILVASNTSKSSLVFSSHTTHTSVINSNSNISPTKRFKNSNQHQAAINQQQNSGGDQQPNQLNNSFVLPQYYHSANANPQALTLASVQQSLQPGSVVFTSPTMAMVGPQGTPIAQQATPTGPGQGPQFLVTGSPGQTVTAAATPQFTGAFQTANGQTHQLIQPASMPMMGGLSHVQVIGANGQSYLSPAFYPQMFVNNPIMAIPAQQPSQSLAILPQAAQTGQVITAQHQAASQSSTPVKNQQTSQTTVMKGVSLSVQQQNGKTQNTATKSQDNSNQSPTQQSAIPFQPNSGNQTFFLGLSPGSNGAAHQNGTNTPTLLSSAQATNARKSNANLVPKIQPSQQGVLTQTQFKQQQYSATNATNSPTAGQAIMVQQAGTGGTIQLANQPAIIGSFQTIPPITWTPQINSGQILIRAPNESPHMLIQTSNNQIQAVPMQMNAAASLPSQTPPTMPITPNGQATVMAQASINPPYSIQANQNVAISSTTMATHQVSVASTPSQPTLVSATNLANCIQRQRPIRPASSTISTQTTTTKSVPGNTAPKIIPKITVTSNTPAKNQQINQATPPRLPIQVIKNDQSLSTVTYASLSNKNSMTKVGASTNNAANQFVGPAVNSSGDSILATHKTPGQTGSKNENPTNQRKTEKKDAASGTENVVNKCLTPLATTSVGTLIKSIKSTSSGTATTVNRVTNSTSTSTTVPSSQHPSDQEKSNSTETSNSNLEISNTTQRQSQASNANSQTKSNSSVVNGSTNTKSTNNTNVNNSNNQAPSNMKSKLKPLKPKPEPEVLTHIIDGFVIKESGLPFPINGFLTDLDNKKSKDSKKINGVNGERPQENGHSIDGNKENNCSHCGKNETVANGKGKKPTQVCSNCISKRQDEMLAKNQPKPSNSNNSTGARQINESEALGQSNQPSSNGVNSSNNLKRASQTNLQDQHLAKKQRASCTNSNKSSTNNSNEQQQQRSQTSGEAKENGTNQSAAESSENKDEADKLWLPSSGDKEPSKWTVQDVCDFISHLDGCADLAEGFKAQEIDGQALMLIKEDHIIDNLNTKLGPALKICRKIKELKEMFSH